MLTLKYLKSIYSPGGGGVPVAVHKIDVKMSK